MRHIDDIFFIWTENEDELEGFLQRLNAFHPNLKFTRDKSKVSKNFLDVKASSNGEEFETDIYCSPTDCHEFLEFNSAHSIYTKKSIAYSQGLRIKRLYSKKNEKHFLKNTLKVYVNGLASLAIPKNLLAIKLGGFLKANQSNCLKVGQRLGLVYHLL